MLGLIILVVVAGWLGYERKTWWVPAAVAVVFAVVQVAVYQGTGGAWRFEAGLPGRSPEILMLGAVIQNLVVGYAGYGVGYAIGKASSGTDGSGSR